MEQDDYSTALDVHSLDEMDHHVRKAAETQSEIDRIDSMYQAEISRLQDRRAEQLRILVNKRDWHLAPVESYHRAHPENRTIPFCYGSSKLRVPKAPVVSISDRDLVTEWARTHHPEVLGAPSIMGIRSVVQVVELEDGPAAVDPDSGLVVEGLDVYIPLPSWSVDLSPKGDV